MLASGGSYPPLRLYDGETVVREGTMHEHREPTPDVPYANIPVLSPANLVATAMRKSLVCRHQRSRHHVLTLD